jgi:hypothetical protein
MSKEQQQTSDEETKENKKYTAKRLGRNIVQIKYDNNENCPLCLREMKNTKVQHTLCGHTFHSNCLEQQFTSEFNNNNKCALCREDITDKNKSETTRPPMPSNENESDFNDDFIRIYSDLTDMFAKAYKLNTKITENGSIDDDDKENMVTLNKDIFDCSNRMIKHLQRGIVYEEAHRTNQEVQRTNDTVGAAVDIEHLLAIVEKTHETVIKAIEDTMTLILNTASRICLQELQHYIKMNKEYKEYIQNNMILDIGRIEREREAERRFRYVNQVIENDDEEKQRESESSRAEREREEREKEEKEMKERETDFIINMNNGHYIDANGNIFDGEYTDGKFNGHCKYTFTNGNVYEGEYKDGKFNGIGKKMYANGNVYQGNYKDGKLNGYGKFVWANGGVYEGQYKDGKKHGRGRLFIPNGLSFRDLSE